MKPRHIQMIRFDIRAPQPSPAIPKVKVVAFTISLNSPPITLSSREIPPPITRIFTAPSAHKGKNGDIVGTTNSVIDPLIGPLADNGGPTLTVALQPGSPAIDAGDDTVLGMVSLDQRGKPRQFGAHVDIGAYELVSPSSMLLTSVSSNGGFGFSFTNTPGVAFTVLSSTNLSLPLSNWTELGAPTEIAPGQFQFLDAAPSNSPQKFYQVRWP
ncbi:MAG TPA: choice-of-anchor Q domain-containing protein [Verrucomicrobiae bacterium]|nr:choice-of-anchor Q domain-containing protein [Verrucomicrobiae bacterium]